MITHIYTHAGPTDRVAGTHVGQLLVIETDTQQTYLMTDPLRAIGRELFRELLQQTELDFGLLEEVHPAGYGGQRKDTEVWVGFDKETLRFWLWSLPGTKRSMPLHELSWREAKTILYAREYSSQADE